MHNRKYADERIAAVYERVAPPCIDLGVDERLVRIDRHQSEYLLLQTLWALFKSRFTNPPRRYYGLFEAQAVLDAWRHLPGSVVRPERNRRQHISSLLSRNEIERDYAYNRALFRRIKQGWYQFNPALRVRRRCGEEQQWVPVLEALNLALVGEFCDPTVWDLITRQLHEAGRTAPAQPLIHAGEVARLRTRREAAQSEHERILAALSPGKQPPTGAIRPAPRGSEPKPNTDAEVRTPRWGSPQARARELARQRKRIEEDRRTRRAAEESKAAPKVFDPVATGSGKDEGTP